MSFKKILGVFSALFALVLFVHVAHAAAPAISNVQPIGVGPYEAQIGWTTDVLSDSQVSYGLPGQGTSSFSNSGTPCSTANGGSATMSHCVDIAGLSPNTLYYYLTTSCVSGECANGTGSFLTLVSSNNTTSTVNNSTTTATSDATPPTAPASISSYVVTSTLSVHVYWSASTDNVGVAGYKVYKNGNLLATASTNSYLDYPVIPGATYVYSVVAFDTVGNISPQSMPTTAIFPALPPPPTNTTSTVSNTTTTTAASDVMPPTTPTGISSYAVTSTISAHLYWPASTDNIAVTGYKIYKNGNLLANSTANSYVDYAVIPGTTYAYSVAAFDAAGNSSGKSSTATVTFPLPTTIAPVTATSSVSNTSTATTTILPPITTTIATTTPIVTTVGTIVGSAIFSNGKPVTDAQVSAYSQETKRLVSVATDMNGRFTLTVSSGVWQVGIAPLNPSGATWSSPGNYPQVTFGTGTSVIQIQTVNFTIASPAATLAIHAVDKNGAAITQASIIIDTVSAGAQPSVAPSTNSAISKSVDANGIAGFSLQAGTYYVRAYLPSSLGFFNPNEQSVTLNSGDTKSLSLVFEKQATAATAILSGVTTLGDGTPVSAFVWAWSEDGKTTQVTSDQSGNFSFPVTNGRWHVGAGKSVNGYPYQSSNLTVDVDGANASVSVVLSQSGTVLSPAVTIANQSSAQTITAQAKDGASVTIPSGASTASGPLSVTVSPTVEVPSQAGGKVVSVAYDVSLTTATGTAITSFSKEIQITLPYNAADLAAQGISVNKLVPSYYDEKSGTWIKVDSYFVDTVHSAVVIQVNHLTRFALIAAADITPPVAPQNITASASSAGVISLAWTNPATDFDHVKIYRSTTLGDIGKILVDDVVGASATDNHVTDKATYYYTVVAVDPVGNESTNLLQVTATANGTSAGASTFARALRLGSRGTDVSALQSLLVKEGVYQAGIISGYFGNLTRQAVILFQQKYQSDILAPYGLTNGTGVVGIATRAKLNQLSQ